MKLVKRARPSAALVISVLALVAALGGAAIAGPGAGNQRQRQQDGQEGAEEGKGGQQEGQAGEQDGEERAG